MEFDIKYNYYNFVKNVTGLLKWCIPYIFRWVADGNQSFVTSLKKTYDLCCLSCKKCVGIEFNGKKRTKVHTCLNPNISCPLPPCSN